MDDGKAMIGVREVAARLAVSVSTVRRLLKSGELRSMRVGRQVRVDEAWIDGYKNTTNKGE